MRNPVLIFVLISLAVHWLGGYLCVEVGMKSQTLGIVCKKNCHHVKVVRRFHQGHTC